MEDNETGEIINENQINEEGEPGEVMNIDEMKEALEKKRRSAGSFRINM